MSDSEMPLKLNNITFNNPKETLQFLEKITSYVPGGIYWKDKNGHYLGCNDYFLKIVKLNVRSEIIGKTDYDLWPAETEEFRKADKKIMESGEPTYFENRVITPDGTQIYILTLKMPLLNNKGRITGIVGNSFDITHIKNNQDNFGKEHKIVVHYLDSVISSVPGSIYWKDKQGVYLGCNSFMVQTAGLASKENIIGKTDYELWPEQAIPLRENDQFVMESGNPIKIEERIVLPNGMNKFFTVVKMPLRDFNNNIIGIIGNSLEITELKNTQSALKEAKEHAEIANQAKTEFLANMSHDIRTPLAGMIGMMELIAMQSKDSKIKEYVQDVLHSSQQLLTLLNNILEVTKTDLGHIPNQQQSINLRQLLRELEELYYPSIVAKKLRFQLSYDSQIPESIKGNVTLIHRILLNLLSNAIKFTESGKITLAAKQVETNAEQIFIEFSIKDTGIGIAEDKLNVILGLFTRLTPSYQGIYKGSGLGLYIVKQFVNHLGGKIKVQSKLGKGSTFSVTIPLEKSLSTNIIEPGKKAYSADQLSQASQSSQPHLLVVEDDKLAGKAAVIWLQQLNCLVDWATSGKDALDKVKNNSYQLIYIDIGLPDQKGYEVAQAIRLWEQRLGKQHTPIIALTAHVSEEGKKKCLESGIQLVINKPINLKLIEQHLKQFTEDLSLQEA